MTTATATRDASFHSLTDLGEKQAAVLAVIAGRGPISNRAIAETLGWDVNRVTLRVFELRERGLVVEAGTTWDAETGRNVTLWYVISHDAKSAGDSSSNCPAFGSRHAQEIPEREISDATYSFEKTPASTGFVDGATFKTPAWSTPLGQRLLQASEISKVAGLTGFWPGLVAILYAVETYEELDKEWAKINRYRISKQPEFETILKIKEQRKQELSK